jgi:hypothetical protein
MPIRTVYAYTTVTASVVHKEVQAAAYMILLLPHSLLPLNASQFPAYCSSTTDKYHSVDARVPFVCIHAANTVSKSAIRTCMIRSRSGARQETA